MIRPQVAGDSAALGALYWDSYPKGVAAVDLEDAIEEMVVTVADLSDLTREARYRVETVRRETPKVGRNDPCHCGSGKKFKQCHGAS